MRRIAAELQAHRERENPEVDTAAGKMAVLEHLGFYFARKVGG